MNEEITGENELRDQALLGMEAEKFRASLLGQYLVKTAEDNITEAFKVFVTLDAEVPEQIRAIQNQAKVAEMFLDWIDEAIADGHYAIDEIRNENND